MSINNREDANRYYQQINGLVDEYIDKWKIRPSNLKKYLQPGSDRFNKFLERNKLKDIKGASRVLSDVIDDRYHMEKDGVITFESFKLFESDEYKFSNLCECLYKGIEKSNIEHEKIIADYYGVSLGHIDIVDSIKHVFKIDDLGDEKYIIILSGEEMDIIKNNINEFLLNEAKNASISLSGIEIKLENLLDEETLKDKIGEILSNWESKKTKELISKCLEIYTYDCDFEGYSIWEKNES